MRSPPCSGRVDGRVSCRGQDTLAAADPPKVRVWWAEGWMRHRAGSAILAVRAWEGARYGAWNVIGSVYAAARGDQPGRDWDRVRGAVGHARRAAAADLDGAVPGLHDPDQPDGLPLPLREGAAVAR